MKRKRADNWEKYKCLDKIGEGTYAEVFEGRNREGNSVALKIVRVSAFISGLPPSVLRETKALKQVNSENVSLYILL